LSLRIDQSPLAAPRRVPHKSGKGLRPLALRYSRVAGIFQRFFRFNAIKWVHCYLRKPSVALKKAGSSRKSIRENRLKELCLAGLAATGI
jgi:hypothetical protein